jgi:hypothetical protein
MTTPTIFIIINVPRVTKPDSFFVMVDYNLKLKIVILNDGFSNGSDIYLLLFPTLSLIRLLPDLTTGNNTSC